MLRLLTTIFLISAGIFVYSYFRELNPGTITVRTGPSTPIRAEPRDTGLVFHGGRRGARRLGRRHAADRPRHRQLAKHSPGAAKGKGRCPSREGTHAFMSKRTVDAIGLFEKALAIDPNRVDSLLWLGNIYRSESNYCRSDPSPSERANRVDDRNIEILLGIGKDLEGAKRYEDALQTLQKILKNRTR